MLRLTGLNGPAVGIVGLRAIRRTGYPVTLIKAAQGLPRASVTETHPLPIPDEQGDTKPVDALATNEAPRPSAAPSVREFQF